MLVLISRHTSAQATHGQFTLVSHLPTVELSICVIGFHSQALLSKGGLRYGKKRLHKSGSVCTLD